MEARLFAYQALKAICIEHAYANLYLKKYLHQVDSSSRDFCSALIYGTLQNDLYLGYQYQGYVKKACSLEVDILLKMSIYQLLMMNEKEYAVVNEAVKLADKKQKGFVNAILRKVIRNGRVALPSDEMQSLSIETSHPLWLIKMWKAQYGWENTWKIAHSNQEVRKISVRVNTLKINREDLGDAYALSEDVKDGAIYLGKNIFNDEHYLNHEVLIQDLSSQMVATILDPHPNELILDACSAPGSKAMHIACLMKNQGKIICGDIHSSRVELIKQRANELALSCIEAEVRDAINHQDNHVYDRILCDVPCSGYGVLARKSDRKYHMQSEEMDALIPIQYQILEASSKLLKHQGILVYSTCTLNRKENEKQIERFIKEYPDFVLLESQTIFPFIYHSDGFYIAKLKKL